MSQELIYTSAPRGLKPGSRGFCTVLSTQGMPAPLAATLEGLSAYRPLFPPADPRAADNPVVWSHLKITAIGRTMHLLSRIADSGFDYSDRANKLAHHLILDPPELLPAGPASLLMTPGLLRTAWTDEPRVVPPKMVRQSANPPAGVCTAWQALTGDAGWAGVLAESFLADPERVVIILFAPGQDVLPLFAESISLLPTDQRWNVTFSTYFTALAPSAKCVWRAMIHDSKEAHESLRLVNALRIDLTQGRPGPAAGGKLVEAARTGVRAIQSLPRRAAAAAVDEVVFAGVEEDAEDDASASMDGVPDLPIRMAKTAPFARRTPAIRHRIEESTQGEVNSSFTSRRALILVPWFLLLVGIAVGVSWKLGVFSRPSPGPEGALVSNDHEAVPEVAVVPETNSVKLPTTQDKSEPPKIKTAPQGETVVSSSDGVSEPGIGTERRAPQHENDKPPAESPNQNENVPKEANAEAPLTEQAVAKSPKFFDPLNDESGFVLTQFSIDEGKSVTPDELHKKACDKSFRPFDLLKPRWLRWTQSVPKNTEANVILGIKDDNSHGQSFATVDVIGKSKSVEYRLKRKDGALRARSEGLAWCGMAIESSVATEELPAHGRFSHPLVIPKENRIFSSDNLWLEWESGFPVSDDQVLEFQIERMIIADEKTKYSLEPGVLRSDSAYYQGIPAILASIKQIAEVKNNDAAIELKVSIKHDESKVVLAFGIVGIDDKSGPLTLAVNELSSQKEAILKVNRDPLDQKYKEHVKKLFSEKQDPLGQIEKLVHSPEITKFVAEKRAALNQQEKNPLRDEQLKQLEYIETLPDQCARLRERFKQLKSLEKNLRQMRIVSAKVTYDVFRVSEGTNGKAIKLDFVNFDENDQ